MICVDLLIVNKRGHTDQSEFEPFCNSMVHVVEMYGAFAYVHWHTEGGDLGTATNISYYLSINSVAQLIKVTFELLESEGKEKGGEFKVPHYTWVMLQISPLHENRKTYKHHIGRLPFKRYLQYCSTCDKHPHGHWVAHKKRLWWYHGWKFWKFLEAASKN